MKDQAKTDVSLQEQIQNDLGLPESSFSSHYSDLHVLHSPELEAWLKTRPDLKPCILFSDVEGALWYGQRFYDFPFRYQPYWDRRLKG